MAYGVYKAFKSGDCMDGAYIVVLSTEDEAKHLVEMLEELRCDDRRDLPVFGGNDGWEFRSYWTYEEIRQPRSLEDFIAEKISDCLEFGEERTAHFLASKSNWRCPECKGEHLDHFPDCQYVP